MGTASHYWRLVRIDSAGSWKAETIASAETFFKQQFPTLDYTDVVDSHVQQHLLTLVRERSTIASDAEAQTAALCLRCFISNQIQQVCLKLEAQFGSSHGFTRHDLVPLVLDDVGDRVPVSKQGTYQSFAMKVLESFDPSCSSLSTWTTRLVKCHPELNAFLLERGVYLISTWALLNDTTPKQLQRILIEFHQLSTVEVEQAYALLEVYHAVYRRDRLKQRQAGIKGACLPPNLSQLQQIAQGLQPKLGRLLAAETLMAQLQTLGDRVREYRLYVKGGFRSTESLDSPENPDSRALIDSIPAPDASAEAEDDHTAFLTAYRQQFRACLDQATGQVTRDRIQLLQRKGASKAQQFITALQLFHCQGKAMGDIAQAVGLEAQYQVTRLLNLKPFRADIRQTLLTLLRDRILEQATRYVSPDRLKNLDQQFDAALDEQVGVVFQEAEAEASTAKHRSTTSLFSRTLCQQVDQLIQQGVGSRESGARSQKSATESNP
ncbi:MAG: hypothetical protein ACAF41_09240 [Leptolyngbya sp. BL-A-14]